MDNEPQNFNWEPLEFENRAKKDTETIENKETPIDEKDLKNDIVLPWGIEEEPEKPVAKTSYFSKPSKKKAIDETIARFNIREETVSADTQDIYLTKEEEVPGKPSMVMNRTASRPEMPLPMEPDIDSEGRTLKEKILPLKGDSKNTLIKKGVAIVLTLTIIICAVAFTILHGKVAESEITPKTGVVMTEDKVMNQEEDTLDKDEDKDEEHSDNENGDIGAEKNGTGNTQAVTQ